MDELLQQLEVRLRSLLQKCELLHTDNANLKQNKSLLHREKEVLLAKNKTVISQIENMIVRLKSIESAHE